MITPFPALETTTSTHVTYLDTTGRPAVTFQYGTLTDKHNQLVYVGNTALFVRIDSHVLHSGYLQSTLLGAPQEAFGCGHRFPQFVRIGSGGTSYQS